MRLKSFVVLASLMVGQASGGVLVDNSTLGYYNSGIGGRLVNTGPFFTGDPRLSVSSAPDLSAAATQLGGWLTEPLDLATPGSTWSSGPVSIPTAWANGTSTAVIYSIGESGYKLGDVSISIGVDNGILVWLDGSFVHGDIAPGLPHPLGEYVYNLGDLSSGVHHLQLLRVGLGVPENWNIQVTGTLSSVPEPSSLALIGLGALSVFLCWLRR
ncbi:PEP-CTERM sorting domain-containing protein [Paludisphaera mucosa]|uniref:PEP-CTERM sorting domain-containing protein n=1 Tax=Paludisphaera mucosa TaxID=3030827 RepID=A0ABT6FBX3_9BACT|nr:PEP-CTERM sorting domain-containing protein [Paludisphaera mucosa]MDG3005045.1 PEP-CTERM sorting domain-containing protein [Paludisphaera mucosa]